MKKLSLQWRITLMTALLIGATCVFMNVLTGYSGRHNSMMPVRRLFFMSFRFCS